MRRAAARPTAGRILRRQVALTLLVSALTVVPVVLGAWHAARAEAHRAADRVATGVSGTVLADLATHDLQDLGAGDRADLLAELGPYLRAGLVHRVKIWTVRGNGLEIVASDEPRLIGDRIVLGEKLSRVLETGEPLVLTVPHDVEHRFELAEVSRLLEVFRPFRDARGRPALLEVYVPVAVQETALTAAAVLVPLTVGGVLLLGLVLIPAGVRLGREVDRRRTEQRAAERYGLAAAERTRRAVARDLHDEVLPGLASAGLLLDAARRQGSDELLRRARGQIADDVGRIRTLLDGYASPPPAGGLREAFAALAGRFERPGLAVALMVDDTAEADPATVEFLGRIAAELLRNASVHAGATAVRVGLSVPRSGGDLTLQVRDDGSGFDPGRPPAPGHVGLTLVRRAVQDAGGRLEIVSTPGAGTTATVSIPALGAIPFR